MESHFDFTLLSEDRFLFLTQTMMAIYWSGEHFHHLCYIAFKSEEQI